MQESPSSNIGSEHLAREIRLILLAIIDTEKKKIIKNILPAVLLKVGSLHEDVHGSKESTARPQPAPTGPLFRSYGFFHFKSAL